MEGGKLAGGEASAKISPPRSASISLHHPREMRGRAPGSSSCCSSWPQLDPKGSQRLFPAPRAHGTGPSPPCPIPTVGTRPQTAFLGGSCLFGAPQDMGEKRLSGLLRPAGWFRGGRRSKLPPAARPSPCRPLISWTSSWGERRGMTPGFDPTSKVRAGRGAPKPDSHPHAAAQPQGTGTDPGGCPRWAVGVPTGCGVPARVPVVLGSPCQLREVARRLLVFQARPST